ncbi:alpha/beta fold hydrolase [Silvibacterium sp.]|uniref:alpha/beta fold hydrolase n=1 Tax=Silvibacterium sp. TaxID=1964179 RepID=UPI0039E3D778
MHVSVCGEGAPVLFLHGMPTSGRLWDGVISRLCTRYRCVAVDLPGLGRSPRAPHSLGDLRTIADQLDQIRQQQGIERWHVVGHDAGAVIAVHYAQFFSDRVERLSLLAPALFPELKPYFLIEPLRRAVVGELLAPVIRSIFWKVAMQKALEGIEDGPRLARDFYEPFAGTAGAMAFLRLVRWGQPQRLLAGVPAMLPTLRMPTLIFHGAADPVVPAEFAERASRLMPDARLLTLDCGHFIPLCEPASVAEELERFFAA